MTTTLLPDCGIWTTDMEGERIIGFTSEQFLSVWQARADLEAENKRLREALERLARLGNGDHYGNSDGNMIARAALKETP